MFQINGSIFHGDGLFHRNHVHTDSGSSRRHHMGNPVQGDKGHALKETGQRRMFPETFIAFRPFFHIKELRGARHEHGQTVSAVCGPRNGTVVVVVIAVVIFQKADIAHFIQHFLKMLPVLFLHFIHFPEFFNSVMAAYFHGQGNICHFFCDDFRQSPVFRIGHCQSFQLVQCHVGNLSSKFHYFFTGRFVAHMRRDNRFAHFRHNVLLSFSSDGFVFLIRYTFRSLKGLCAVPSDLPLHRKSASDCRRCSPWKDFSIHGQWLW